MSSTAARAALRRVFDAIHPLDDAEWAALEPSVGERRLAKGEPLVRAGREGHEAGLVISGFMRTYYLTPEGDEVVTAFCVPGSFSCAYAAALAREPAAMTIEALTACELATFDVRRFRELVEAGGAWAVIGRRVVEAEYVHQEKRLAGLLTRDAKVRVEEFRATQRELWVSLSQKDIASYLGLSRETLNRIANAKSRP